MYSIDMTPEQVRQIIRQELALFMRSDRFTFQKDIEMQDGRNIQLATGTGTKLGTGTGEKLGFFNATPVVRQTALTPQESTITFVEPLTPDYAINEVTSTSPFGFANANEGNTFIGVVENLQVRMTQLVTRLTSYGLLP